MIKEKKSILNSLTLASLILYLKLKKYIFRLNTIFNEVLEISQLFDPLFEPNENNEELVKEILTIIEDIQIKL